MPKNLVLIAGQPACGKTASLRNIRKPEGVFFLNCEAGKSLPFKAGNKFKKPTGGLEDPNDVFEYFNAVEEMDDIHTIVIDSIDFLMEMYESQHVLGSVNTMQGWSNYQQFFKQIMQEVVQRSKKNWIIIGHQAQEPVNEMEFRYYVPIKGAVARSGVAAYFNVVMYARKVKLKEIEKTVINPDLLHITEKDKANGFKYVFQVEVTKEYANSEIRSPMGLWEDGLIFIDNDVQVLLDYLDDYYEQEKI
jgi:N4 gp44-like protein